MVDQWWAPRPWKTRTKTIDFREGGFWLYAMVGPNGEEHWARADYKSVIKEKGFQAHDTFCDSNGIINKEFPQSFWKTDFIEYPDSTFVKIEMTFEKLEDLEKNIAMGFKEGLTMAFTNLDEVLSQK